MDVGFSGTQGIGGAFTGASDGGSASGAESNGRQVAPSFLFGNNQSMKRRSFALPATAKPVSTASKTVTWSPELIREHLITPRKERDSGGSATPAIPSPPPAASDYSFTNRYGKPLTRQQCQQLEYSGPPLRSLRQDVGPPTKLARIDELDQPMTGALSAESRDSLARSGPEAADGDYWVTVFGFPPDNFDTVLEIFGRHGNIVSHKKPPEGNWVHIRYSSVIHAQQALARNAKVTGGKMMLGVIPCSDPDVTDDSAANWTNHSMLCTDSSLSAPSVTVESLNGDVRPPVSVQRSDSLNSSRLAMSSRAGMRSLRTTEADISMDTHSPNTSLLGKFWNFVTAAPGNHEAN
ncbi:CBN-NPP-19 protein [Aphelenchoides avenae]|nr:CBN-NPP-19 protein [Aphelenchus avenae]